MAMVVIPCLVEFRIKGSIDPVPGQSQILAPLHRCHPGQPDSHSESYVCNEQIQVWGQSRDPADLLTRYVREAEADLLNVTKFQPLHFFVHREQPDLPLQVTPGMNSVPDLPQKLRAPFLRLFSVARAGNLSAQPALFIGSDRSAAQGV